MTAVPLALYFQDGTYTAAHDRFNLSSPLDVPMLLNTGSQPAFPHGGGVLPNLTASTTGNVKNAMEVTAPGELNIEIKAGTVIVDATNVGLTAQGVYVGHNQGVANLTLAARPNTGQSRIDVIYAGFRDQDTGATASEFVLGAITGTPASSNPTMPTPSAIGDIERWIPLATVVVPGTGGGPLNDPDGLVDQRQWVNAVGGVRLAKNTGYYASGIPHLGDLRYNLDNHNFVWYKGGGNAGWKIAASEDYVRDEIAADGEKYRPAVLQHNPLKRTRSPGGWDGTPEASDSGVNGNWNQVGADELRTGTFQTPTGRIIIALSALMGNELGSDAADSVARMGVRIQQGNTTPATGVPDVSNAAVYAWTQNRAGTATFTGSIINLPAKTDLTARLVFQSSNNASYAYFRNTNISVIPVV